LLGEDEKKTAIFGKLFEDEEGGSIILVRGVLL
jgi:hypothetical protein